MMLFTVALFVNAKNQKRLKSTGKGLGKLWYIFTIEHYAVIKNKEVLYVLIGNYCQNLLLMKKHYV